MDKNLELIDLKQVGLKVTVPRVKILKLFEASDQKHLSADDVYKSLIKTEKSISIATVYRVLTQFESSGILDRHNFDSGHSLFELRSNEHHDHLLCIKCNKVSEFIDNEIEKRQIKIAAKIGFEITDHCMTIYGICNNCK